MSDRVRVLIYNWSGSVTPELYFSLRVWNEEERQWDEYQTTKMTMPPTLGAEPLSISSGTLSGNRKRAQLHIKDQNRELLYTVTESKDGLFMIYLVNDPNLSIPDDVTIANQYTYNAGYDSSTCYIMQGNTGTPCDLHTFPTGSHVIPVKGMSQELIYVVQASFPPTTEQDAPNSFWLNFGFVAVIFAAFLLLLALGFALGRDYDS